jgi:hypothetical protein
LGCEIDARDSDGVTALARAARYGDVEAAQALINHGADPGSREINGVERCSFARPKEAIREWLSSCSGREWIQIPETMMVKAHYLRLQHRIDQHVLRCFWSVLI